MVTCRDCLHDEACRGLLEAMGCIVDGDGKNADTLCDKFESRCNMIEVPCKIGDFVWAIRSFRGHKHPQRGVVSDMYFTNDMRLQIVVKYVARGEWGKTVFATDKEAYAAIETEA